MYVRRDLEDALRRYLASPEMLLILGPRQSGKSTLIQHVAAQLPKSNLISFEDVDLLALFEADPKAFAGLHVEGYRTVFIDEAQYARSFGKHMKYLIDTYKDRVKFVATGSSVTDFYLQGLKFLVGRVFVFHLYPFSFREFLRYRNEKLLPLVDRPELQPECKKLLEEFVTYGGYPRAVLAESVEEKRLVLKNLYNLLIQREIVSLAKLLDQQKTIALVRLLAVQNVNLINYNNLASDCSLTVHQLRGLLNLLQKTFVVKLVPPFFTNKSLEIVKNPKVFFVDTGLRNAVLDNFSTLRPDMGAVYKSFVFEEILKADIEVRFWRSKSKAEVDFVVERDHTLIPVEVKVGTPKVSRSFRSFIRRYRPERGLLVNGETRDGMLVDGTRVQRVYFSEMVRLSEWLAAWTASDG